MIWFIPVVSLLLLSLKAFLQGQGGPGGGLCVLCPVFSVASQKQGHCLASRCFVNTQVREVN